MLDDLMNLLSVCWKPFIKGDSSETGAAVNGYSGDGDDFEKDGLLWFRDIGKYGGGEYSMAVVQANQVLEDQSQIESGSFGTFVGVYDGHGGPDVARYVCDNLFRNFQGLLHFDVINFNKLSDYNFLALIQVVFGYVFMKVRLLIVGYSV